MALTTRQRDVLRILVRSGETWQALQQIFEDEAQHALQIQDGLVASGKADSQTLATQVAWHTAVRQVYVNLAQLIDDEAHNTEK